MIQPKDVKQKLLDVRLSNHDLLDLAEQCLNQSLLGSAIRVARALGCSKLLKRVQASCLQEERYSYAYRL